jgi:hypothetical protein
MGLYNDPKFTAAVDAVRFRGVMAQEARSKGFDAYLGAMSQLAEAQEALTRLILEGLDTSEPEGRPLSDIGATPEPDLELAPSGITPITPEDIETWPHDPVDPEPDASGAQPPSDADTVTKPVS